MVELTDLEKQAIEKINGRDTFIGDAMETPEKLFGVVIYQMEIWLPQWAPKEYRRTLLLEQQALLNIATKLNEADVIPDDYRMHLNDDPFTFIWPDEADEWERVVCEKYSIIQDDWDRFTDEKPNWKESDEDALNLLAIVREERKGVLEWMK